MAKDNFSPWVQASQPEPFPKPQGTNRDFGNMLNEKVKKDKPRKMGTHWELPKKLKLGF